MTHLIGITGKARAGKDTVASMILDMYPSELYNFTKPVKAGLQVMLGLTWAQTDGDLKDTVIDWLGCTPRDLENTLGADWGRDMVHPDIWLIIAKRKWNMCKSVGKTLVVTGVRPQNEVEWIREEGKLVHVYRDDAKGGSGHSIESGPSYDNSRDLMICNNGSIEELRATVRGIL